MNFISENSLHQIRGNVMRLRLLKEKDAVGMLEWMHDTELVQFLSKDFSERSIDDCRIFIEESSEMEHDMNLAIVDDDDNYMGTVSLKNIDKKMQDAEFAIAVRRCAMGKGYAKYGIEEIIRIGKMKLGLKRIYWCVSRENRRAIRFYDKNGYGRVSVECLKMFEGGLSVTMGTYLWYLVDTATVL